jgi:hypothetical protein
MLLTVHMQQGYGQFRNELLELIESKAHFLCPARGVSFD